jgi:hypothetical protein
MRPANPAYALARTAFARLNGFHRKRLNVDELSDHMRSDLGLVDGRSRHDAALSDGDSRLSRLDPLTLTRFAS